MRPPSRHTSVAARATYHYAALTEALSMSLSTLRGVEGELTEFAREYREIMGPCRLVLYLNLSRKGRPQALYWGCTFRRATDDGIQRWRRHIKGRLTKRTIYRIARRYSERDKFFRYDDQRLALNEQHAALARGLDRVRKSVMGLKIPSTRLPKAMPHVMPPCLQDEPALVEASWRVAWACALVDDEMLRSVAKEGQLLPRAALFPYAAVNRGYVALGWAERNPILRDGRVRTGRRHVTNRLTADDLQRYGVPEACWPAFWALDRRMAVLRREHGRYSRAIGIAKLAAAQAAKGSRAPGMVVNGSAQTPISSLPSPTIP